MKGRLFTLSAGRGWFVVVLAAVLVTIALSLLFGTVEAAQRNFYDEGVYRTLTRNLLDHGFYGYAEGELVAYRAPGYPFFNAGIRMVNDSYLSIRIAQALLAGGIVLVTALFTRRLARPGAAAAAAVALTLVGAVAAYSSVELTETLATFTFASALLLACVAWQHNKLLLAGVAGLVLGISILTRPQALLAIPVVAVFFIVMLPGRQGRFMAAAFLGVVVLVLAPWTVRNYVRLDAFVPVSTEGGVNFWLANNPDTTGRFQEIDEVNPELYSRISMLDEVAQDREWIRLGFQYIFENPVDALGNWLRNSVVFLGSRDPWVHQQSNVRGVRMPFLDDRALLPLVAIGLVMQWRSRNGRARFETLLPLFVIAYTVGFFMITIPHARFRHEMLPFVAFYAGIGAVGLFGLAQRALARRRSNTTVPQPHKPP